MTTFITRKWAERVLRCGFTADDIAVIEEQILDEAIAAWERELEAYTDELLYGRPDGKEPPTASLGISPLKSVVL